MSNAILPAVYTTRRTFLKTACLGTTLLAGGGLTALLQACIAPAPPASTTSGRVGAQPVEITLTAEKQRTPILAGPATETWGYRGEIVSGDADVVQSIPGSYLGPILHLRQGQRVRVNLQNALDEATIIHWHGLIMPPDMDGHPHDAVDAGQRYTYEFEVKNRAGTYWFHPHPHGRTAYQAYQGLAGLVIVTDEEEAELALPTGAYDLPLVIQDRTFDADNQLVYLPEQTHAMAGMDHGTATAHDDMGQTMGFLGDRILVNGTPDLVLPVATRVYRLRLLNGSSSRIYKLVWSNGLPLTVIATDGGLLENPVQRPYITLAPGERVDLWADFSQLAVGDEFQLQSLAFTGVEAGMFMDGVKMEMAETAALPNGAAFDVLTVRVAQAEAETLTLPAQLARLARLQAADAVNADQPRPFAMGMAGGAWLLNGKTFVMDEVNDDEKVALGSVEVWEFINELPVTGPSLGAQGHQGHHMNHDNPPSNAATAGETVDFMAHPMHIHGVQFQVLHRQIDPAYEEAWHTLSAGFVDEGWKDTVLVMPGERVQIGVRFGDYAGRYLVHCHNLEHENAGMMRNFLIV